MNVKGCYRKQFCQEMIAELTIVLLVLIVAVDLVAIIGGYFELPLKLYWLADADGFLPFLRDDIPMFSRQVESQRDMILVFIFFGAAWSLMAIASAIYFRKRRFVASNWPLSFFKLGSCVLLMRLFQVAWIVHKFHFSIMLNILEEFDEYQNIFADGGKGITWDVLKELYENGTIGAIPLILTGSIALNVIITLISISIISNTAEWRKLNITKHFY